MARAYKCNGSNEHSKAFIENDPKDLFLDYSYGGDHFDQCTRDNRQKLLEKLSGCKGKFCVNGGYSKYYQSHIIDTEHCYPDIDAECDMRIMGNVILAYDVWGQQLGNSNHEINAKEKSVVYGEIFHRAKKSVIECCIPGKEQSSESIVMICLSACIAVAATIIAVMIYFIRKRVHVARICK